MGAGRLITVILLSLAGLLFVASVYMWTSSTSHDEDGPHAGRSIQQQEPEREVAPARKVADKLGQEVESVVRPPPPTVPSGPQKAKLFDCFIFHSELDWLEIHLGELYDVVDTFVLVEAKQSHTGNPKPLIYAENKHKLPEKLRSKVFHVVIENFDPLIVNYTDKIYDAYGWQWKRERAQRERFWPALMEAGLQPGDLVNVGDLDEIFNPIQMAKIKAGCDRVHPDQETQEQKDRCGGFPIAMPTQNYVYNFNWENHNTWFSTQVFRYNGSNLQTVSRSSIGVLRVDNARWINFGYYEVGWHCSWCYSSLEDVQLKFMRSTHQELNRDKNKDIDNIQKSICEGRALFREAHPEWKFTRVDPKKFRAPKYVLDRPERFRYLMPGDNCTLPLRDNINPRLDKTLGVEERLAKQ